MTSQNSKRKSSVKQTERINNREFFGEVAQDTLKTAAALPKDVFSNAWDQLLGAQKQVEGVDQKLIVTQEEIKKENARLKSQLQFERLKIQRQRELGLSDNREVEVQIQKMRQQLQEEIARLRQEAVYLSHEVTAISVEQSPAEAGIYHLNFFSWVIESINLARKKVQEAASWLIVWQTKSAKQRGMIFGFKGNRGQKSIGGGVHMMIGSEMGTARTGA